MCDSTGADQRLGCSRPLARSVAPGALAVTIAMAACDVGPKYVAPSEILPNAFVAGTAPATPPADPELREWWTKFDDSTLTELIAEGDRANQTLAAALANVKSAWAGVGITESQFWPSVGLAGKYAREKVNITQVAAEGVDVSPYDVYAYGVGMSSWEIDIWGRIKNQVTAATEGANATLDSFRGLLISIRAQIAATYIQARTLQARIEVAESVLDNLQQTVDLVALKVQHGTTDQMSLDRATAEMDMSASGIPPLRAAYDSTVSTLAVLCGTTTAPMLERLAASPGAIPDGPDVLSIGIPASLLERRADVQMREREYHASIATIAATEALHLPSLSLSGNFYISSNTVNGLGDISNQAYSFGPSINWPLFEGGRINSQVAQAKAKADEALANYRGAVLTALADVESSASSVGQSQEALALQERALGSAAAAFDLATLQFEQGLIDLTTLLSIANTLADVENAVVQTQGLAAQDIVTLYKALGGGWESATIAEDAAAILREKPDQVEDGWRPPAAESTPIPTPIQSADPSTTKGHS